MNGKRLYLIAAITVAVAMALIIPVYAYTSSVSVSDNTVSSTARTIDIEDQTDPFSVTPPEFESLGPVWVRNHTFELVADDDVEMRAWLYLDDPSDWLILDHAELIIYSVTEDPSVLANGNVQKYVLNVDTFETVAQGSVDPESATVYYVRAYDEVFGENLDGESSRLYWSFVPTQSMTLDPEKTYKFDLVFHFKGLVGKVLYDEFAEEFEGSITFAMADRDPVPTPVQNP